MSIVRMATIPGYVNPRRRSVLRARPPGTVSVTQKRAPARGPSRFDWRTLLAEAYPVIGLTLIVAYVLWAFFGGEALLDWPAPLPATE